MFFIDNVVSYTWSNPVLLQHLFFFSKSLMKTIQIQNNQFIHGVMFKGVKSLLKLYFFLNHYNLWSVHRQAQYSILSSSGDRSVKLTVHGEYSVAYIYVIICMYGNPDLISYSSTTHTHPPSHQQTFMWQVSLKTGYVHIVWNKVWPLPSSSLKDLLMNSIQENVNIFHSGLYRKCMVALE